MPAVTISAATTPPNVLGSQFTATAITTDPSLAGWSVFDADLLTQSGGRVTAANPVAGTLGLAKDSTSAGPVSQALGKYNGLKFTNAALEYLIGTGPLPASGWGVAAVVHEDAVDVAKARDLLAVYGAGKSYRLHRNVGLWSVYEGTTQLIAGDTDIRGTTSSNYRLVIMDCTGAGVLGMRVRSPSVTGGIKASAAQTPATVIGTSPRLVLGADEIADGAGGAAPNASRSWGHGVMEVMQFRAPILTVPARLAAIDAYFAGAYL